MKQVWWSSVFYGDRRNTTRIIGKARRIIFAPARARARTIFEEFQRVFVLKFSTNIRDDGIRKPVGPGVSFLFHRPGLPPCGGGDDDGGGRLRGVRL